jgi:thiosulfate/3-mercaptopyruvate sulfurtransferase
MAWTADSQQPKLLIEAAELAQPELAKSVRILDARTRHIYSGRHIPGAVWVDLDAWDKAFRDRQAVSFWQKEIGALGIDLNTPVIVYDDGAGVDAATVWWLLRFWGVKDVRILNSGWAGWLFARKSSSRSEPHVEARPVKLQPQYARLAVKSQVLEIVQSGREQLIDVRPFAEFIGEQSTARRSGAIPAAKRLDWNTGLEGYYHMWRFKSAEGLADAFRGARIDPARPITIYGHSRDAGALLAFSLELLGAKNVRVYYGGWDEWGNAMDTPILGPVKKKPDEKTDRCSPGSTPSPGKARNDVQSPATVTAATVGRPELWTSTPCPC